MDKLDLQIVEMARDMLVTTLVLAGPIMLVGLVVGVLISLFQALTSVQEQTMSQVPKMLAVLGNTQVLFAHLIGLWLSIWMLQRIYRSA